MLLGTFGMAPLLKTNFFDQGEQEVLSVKQELAPAPASRRPTRPPRRSRRC
ncbi:hypothetical protein ACFQVA_09135 [Actinomadura keratinilytica]